MANINLSSSATPDINIRTLIAKIGWAAKLTWSTHKLLLSGILTVALVQSLAPAGFLLTGRALINEVVAVLNGANDNTNALLFWLGSGMVLTLATAIGSSANQLFTRRLQDELNLRITSDILEHAAHLDLAQFEDPRLQDIIERAQQNTAQNFSKFIASTLSAVIGSIQIISLSIILVFIEPVILLLFLPIILPYVLYQWSVAKTHYHLKRSQSTKRRWARYFVKQVTEAESVAEVKVLGLAPLLKREFRSVMEEFRNQDRRLYGRSFKINVVFAVLSALAAYTAFTRVAFRVASGGLSIGDVAIYGAAATRFQGLVESTITAIVTALEQALFVSNLMEFFEIKSQIKSGSELVVPLASGEIELKDVTFTYPGSREPVLKDVSLHIEPGQTVAIVGENGAGKSTLAKLIARLYDPDCGSILFDGHEMSSLSIDHLHAQISFVPQVFGRYEATVADNIAYGNWRQLLNDRKRIEQLARLAGAHDMVEAMPHGYDSMLGRRFGDYTLSGGQWQQIALARAFGREAKLLILDEPTSSLDARSEYKMFRRFQKLAQGRTTILISQRFSTVAMANRIFVMDKGQIVEAGTHQELTTKGGQYASLYKLHQQQLRSLTKEEKAAPGFAL